MVTTLAVHVSEMRPRRRIQLIAGSLAFYWFIHLFSVVQLFVLVSLGMPFVTTVLSLAAGDLLLI